MKYKTCLGAVALILFSNFGFSQVDGSLVGLSQEALTKNAVLKRNILAVKNAEADLQVQQSTFDYNLLSDLTYQRAGYRLFESDPRNQYLDKILKTNDWDFNGVLQKKLRTSQILEVGANYGFNNNNVPFNSYSQPIPVFRGDYSGTLNFSVTQPLLRGRGKNITTIPERTSELIVEMVKDQNIYAASNELLQISSAYWNYYNAYQSLDIYRQNEARVRRVLDMTAQLVKADKKRSGDLVQIQADLANQEKLTIQATQNLFNSQTVLGSVVGIDEISSRKISAPLDNYPTIEDSGFNSNLNISDLVNMAIENRADLSALDKNMQVLELQNELAENNLKPVLDLTGFAFYGNTSQGNGKIFQPSSLFNSEGRYIGGGAKLTFNFALNNNLAKGNYAKTQIAIADQNVVKENLRRIIELNISNAANNLTSSANAMQKSRQALDDYRLAFENEQAKFQTGLTTLLNVILFQERLTAAELDYLKTQRDYALAIINLRHETGTLFSRKNEVLSINRNSFYTIPSINNQ